MFSVKTSTKDGDWTDIVRHQTFTNIFALFLREEEKLQEMFSKVKKTIVCSCGMKLCPSGGEVEDGRASVKRGTIIGGWRGG